MICKKPAIFKELKLSREHSITLSKVVMSFIIKKEHYCDTDYFIFNDTYFNKIKMFYTVYTTIINE